MRSAAAAISTSFALAACVPTVSLDLPDISEGGSALLFYAPDETTVVAFALSRGQPIALTLPEDAHLELAVLGHTLDALLIEEGRVELVEGDLTRPLPRATSVWSTDTGTNRTPEWSQTGALSATFAKRHLPPFDFERCAESGRCLSDTESEDNRTCTPCDVHEGPLAPDPPDLIGAGCPTGWSEQRGPIPRCVPPDHPPPIDCPDGQVQKYGSAACTMLGDRTCPSGQWADGLPLTGVFRVGAGAPYTTIGAAIIAATRGATIAVAKGMYTETLEDLPCDLTIRGACATETMLLAPADAPVAVSATCAVTIADLQIRGALVGASALPGGRLTLRRVDLTSPADLGVTANRASLTIAESRVRGGTDGCVSAAGASKIDISDTTFERCDGLGVFVSELGTTATITRSIIREVNETPRRQGIGILTSRASLTLRDVLVEDVYSIGIHSIDDSDSASFERVTVRNIVAGATRAETAGVFFYNRRTIVRGLFIDTTVARGLVIGSAADLEHVVIKHVSDPIPNIEGFGIGVYESSKVTARHIWIEDVFRRGLHLRGSEHANFEDVLISGVVVPATEELGAGVTAAGSGTLRLERVRVEDSGGVGALLNVPTTGRSIAIRRSAFDGIIASDINVDFDRVLIESAGRSSIELFGSTGTVAHLTISADPENLSLPSSGIHYDSTSNMEIRDFAIRNMNGPAIHVETTQRGGDCATCMNLHDGIVEGNVVGVQIDHTLFPLWILMNAIRYSENTDTFRFGE